MFRTCCTRLSFTIIMTYTIWNIVLRPSQRLSTLLSISINVFLRNSRSFLIIFISNLPFPCLLRWRLEPFKCSDKILSLSIVSIFRQLRCLLKFDIFNLAILLSGLSIIFESITLDSGNSVWMKFFSYKSLFRMARDESLIPTCKIMFVREHFKYSFRKSFMSFIVAPRKIMTLAKFGFAPDSLFSLISWSIWSPAINVVPFAHWVGVVGGVLLL